MELLDLTVSEKALLGHCGQRDGYKTIQNTLCSLLGCLESHHEYANVLGINMKLLYHLMF